MPNIGSLLKAEITRLSSKSARQNLGALKSAVAKQRKQIIELNKQVAALEKAMKALGKAKTLAASNRELEPTAKVRFSSKGFKALRSKLGVSQDEMAALIGASAQSVYMYEKGRTPRPGTLVAIAALRNVGKREARARLDQISAANKRVA